MPEACPRNTHLERLDLPILRTKLLPPGGLRLGKGLDTSFKLVDLLPAEVELLAHVVQLVAVPLLRLLDALVELGLDLAEGLEARDEVVVEHTEVREWLRLGLTVFLLSGVSVR